MDLQDLREAYLEYFLGRFTAEDLSEYREIFLQICAEYKWIKDTWCQAYFEVSHIMNDVIPYDSNWEYTSPLTGFQYRENAAVYPEVDRPGDFVLIDGEWRIL